MNKEIKKKMVGSVISIVLGLIVLFTTFILKNTFTESKIDYAMGLSSGLLLVGIIIFIRTIFAISGADKGKEFANKLQDERLISINNEASEITFRITTLIAAIASIVLFFMDLEKEGMIASAFVGVSTLIYLVSYFVLSRNK